MHFLCRCIKNCYQMVIPSHRFSLTVTCNVCHSKHITFKWKLYSEGLQSNESVTVWYLNETLKSLVLLSRIPRISFSKKTSCKKIPLIGSPLMSICQMGCAAGQRTRSKRRPRRLVECVTVTRWRKEGLELPYILTAQDGTTKTSLLRTSFSNKQTTEVCTCCGMA